MGEKYLNHQLLDKLVPDSSRRDIYNLYPLLVHTRLFGGHYLHSAESILRRFGF
ncbi:MAG: fructosamine kinase family protein [Chlorobiales bacterium]|nr:fructosamine kinase family protein [Chlorobiales bacterium]